MVRSRVTLRDVASRTGVSHQTVSRVINNSDRVSPETRSKVQAAIEEFGYQPNRLARSLVTQKTHTIGLVVADITNPFYFEVVRGVQDTALEQGYNVIVCNTDDNPEGERNILNLLASQEVDGVILATSSLSDQELLSFAKQYKPLVIINREIHHPKISQVSIDIRQGARLAVEHLIEQGHDRIAMISHQGHDPDKVRRVKGYREVLQSHGIEIQEGWLALAPPNLAGGFQAAQELLKKHPEITAIFTYNDLMAIGALRGCFELQVRVPEDCAIIGFDDIKFASMMNPALSTVAYDKTLIGRKTMMRLLDMLEKPKKAFPLNQLDVSLVIREST